MDEGGVSHRILEFSSLASPNLKMAKKIKTTLKLVIPAGEATPAPPLGPTLGQNNVPIMDFVKQFNDKTAHLKGEKVQALITIYEGGSFIFELKKPPVSEMIKKVLKLQGGSGETPRKTVGELSVEQLRAIAEEKIVDLNANDVEAAMKIVAGSAKSMGVKIPNNY